MTFLTSVTVLLAHANRTEALLMHPQIGCTSMKQVEDVSKLNIFLDDWFGQIEDATSLVSSSFNN